MIPLERRNWDSFTFVRVQDHFNYLGSFLVPHNFRIVFPIFVKMAPHSTDVAIGPLGKPTPLPGITNDLRGAAPLRLQRFHRTQRGITPSETCSGNQAASSFGSGKEKRERVRGEAGAGRERTSRQQPGRRWRWDGWGGGSVRASCQLLPSVILSWRGNQYSSLLFSPQMF